MIAIINGKLIVTDKVKTTTHLDNFKQYRHSIQRQDHKKDIIQPYDHNGNPNPEFIRAYPERAEVNYGKENVRKYGNL